MTHEIQLGLAPKFLPQSRSRYLATPIIYTGSGNLRFFAGRAMINGFPGSYFVTVVDNHPSAPSTFSIDVSNSCNFFETGPLVGGNIEIHA